MDLMIDRGIVKLAVVRANGGDWWWWFGGEVVIGMVVGGNPY